MLRLFAKQTVSYHAERRAQSSEQNFVDTDVSKTRFALRLMRYCRVVQILNQELGRAVSLADGR